MSEQAGKPSSSEEGFDLTEEEQEDLTHAEARPFPVAYSGQDFDVEGLVRRLEKNDILIPTFGHSDERIDAAGFQRSFVWNRSQMDRFIESLLLGYPVPGIFLVRQSGRRYLVLDGQQRLKTLQYFYKGVYSGREFALKNVGEQFKGVTYQTLTEDQRRALDDAYFQATIVESDGSPESLELIYQIFERLNSGGTQLTPHEIRVALYAGKLIDYLEQLNQDSYWRELYGRKSPRVRDQELVLRILAFYYSSEEYSRPLKSFLNDFAAQHRNMAGIDAEGFYQKFQNAAKLIGLAAGPKAIRPRSRQVNSALTEALFVGLIRRLDRGMVPNSQQVAAAIEQVSNDKDMIDSTGRSTADEESVRIRLEIATSAMLEA